ncbi:MAG: response regulator transcription factor [Actinomycetia bacterium]|nr:response regulator transcription factor [Actinomycetes bacterium]MCH9800742.1 response regulator transcription factor [Actinomycetes bacterium]
MSGRILVVDDDPALAEMLTIVLRGEGYGVTVCRTGNEALEAIEQEEPAAVLLDVMLPGLNGVQVCQRIRAQGDTPVIMLTARSDTADVVQGLEAGADDYVVKPFKPKELIARLRAQMRPGQEPSREIIKLLDLEIDYSGHTVTRSGEPISLTPLEFELLACLARQPWQVFSRDMLLRDVWGYQHSADTRLVNVHVQRLRGKIEIDPENPRYVITVRGVGYRAGSDV